MQRQAGEVIRRDGQMKINPIILLMMLCIVSSSAEPALSFQQDANTEPKIVWRSSDGFPSDYVVSWQEPVYPPLAKAARVSGAVVVEVTVGEDGTVVNARA